MKRLLTGIVLLFFGGTAALSQEELKLKFRSRALLDAAVSDYGKDNVQGYYRLEDFRIGFKATYGKYEMKADVGWSGDKMKIKDLLLNYHFGNGTLSLGNTYEPFSMDMLISTADLRLHQSASSVLAFTDGRKTGVTYHYRTEAYYLATGFYTCNDINNLGDGQKNAFVSTSRIAWRKMKEDNRLFHIGGAFSFRTKEVNKALPVKRMGSAGITSMFSNPLLEAEVSDMGTELKGVIEALYIAPRWMVQAEYYLNHLNRPFQGKAYRPHGGYIQGGFLLTGIGFGYDSDYGIPGRPVSPKAIELLARFNYTDLNDAHAGISGGEEKDLSLGVNFYLSRYIGMKLNGSYVWVGKHCNEFYQKDFFLGQIRLQYIF